MVAERECRSEAMTRDRAQRSLIVAAMLAVACGCGGCSHHNRMKDVVDAFDDGDFSKAHSQMQPVWEKYHDEAVDAVIFDLEQGTIARAAGQWDASILAFDESWNRMEPYLDIAADTKVTEEVAAAMTNQSVRTYRGTTYDRILACTYQAMNYLQIGDPAKAGVEFVRARRWQEDAVDRERARIDQENQEWRDANEREGAKYQPQSTLDSPEFREKLDAAYQPMAQFQGYADYEVPFATWMRGVFYLGRGAPGDYEQARQCFARTAGMLGKHGGAQVAGDALLASDLAGGRAPQRLCYIVLESGLAPSRKELRIDIPLFLPGVPYVGAAFPQLEYHASAIDGFHARVGSQAPSSTILTDVDSIVTVDFRNRLPAIILATLVSSASKAAVSYALYAGSQNASRSQNGGSAAGVLAVLYLASVLYQVAVNNADLRTWESLPKQFWYARVYLPPTGGEIDITLADGTAIGSVRPTDEMVSVVYLKSVAPGTPLAVHTFGIPRQ